MVRDIWSRICAQRWSHLDRIERYLFNMLDGEATPENSSSRELFRRLYIPGLGAGPYYGADALQSPVGIDELAAIQGEAISAFGERALVTDHSDLVVANDSSARAAWDCVYFRKEFKDVEKTHHLFPVTSAFLKRQRLATEALFSRLAPSTNIERHSDCANYVTTVHLPLMDSSSVINVAGAARQYVSGQVIIFDSSFYHSVDNSSCFNRDILLFNIWHQDLSDQEIAAMMLIRNHWNSAISFDPESGFL
ncbi:MAG: aspartyl/asparaginyl beta-hydroxylase domain-containing protein [Pseudomonadota bacterium]